MSVHTSHKCSITGTTRCTWHMLRLALHATFGTTSCIWLQHRRCPQIVAAEASDHASHHPHNKPKRRVVVTGMGVVTSLGHDPHEFYDNLLEVSSPPASRYDQACNALPALVACTITPFCSCIEDQMLVLHGLLYSHISTHACCTACSCWQRLLLAVPDSLAYDYRHTMVGI